ncbi:MAG: cardiolipin synthase [Methanomicrobiales archaeon]|nr:cardiolipin synthase [Methanomicrobiales archaeon]
MVKERTRASMIDFPFDLLLNLIIPLALGIVDFAIIIYNIAAVVVIIFYERRNPTAALAWVLVLLFIPLLGFLLYLFFGRALYKEQIFGRKTVRDEALITLVREQLDHIGTVQVPPGYEKTEPFLGVMRMLLALDQAFITLDNKVQIFIRGTDKFEAFFAAIEGARSFIHIEYYIIRNDDLGRRVVAALAKKAGEGVSVRLLVDGVGGNKLPKDFFAALTSSGGHVAVFFPGVIPGVSVSLRMNYRDHRKIMVVDGTVGFIGGFNIGDEYLGLDPRFGFWRDTHLRIEGSAVHGLEIRFLMDWNWATNEEIGVESHYLPPVQGTGKAAIQIVSSGPDSRNQSIRDGYMGLVASARESVYIQTPYFIPDEAVFQAIRLVALAGVDVRIIIPEKADHPFVYWANRSYLGDLLEAGVRGYEYLGGFIHAKAIVVDGVAGAVGTANWDIRSFRLNFETTAFFYDEDMGDEMSGIFLKDLSYCREITRDEYERRARSIKFREAISRLFSSLL